MKRVTLNELQEVNLEGVPECITEAPDYVGLGWKLNNGAWEKGQSVLDQEAKDAEASVLEALVKQTYAAMFNGTGTAAERLTRIEKSICWIIKHKFNIQ